MYSYQCPHCGANLDPCERCDCKQAMELRQPDKETKEVKECCKNKKEATR